MKHETALMREAVPFMDRGEWEKAREYAVQSGSIGFLAKTAEIVRSKEEEGILVPRYFSPWVILAEFARFCGVGSLEIDHLHRHFAFQPASK